jgi:endonuclease YncB( thermonuclease family)
MRLRRPRYDVPDAVTRQLARRRWTRRVVVALLLLFGLVAALDHRGCFRSRGDDWTTFDKQPVTLTTVIDGDTVEAQSPSGRHETVRLLGIDAPDLPDGYWSDPSKRALAERVGGKSVTLRLDSTQTRDAQHRLLAYVYYDDADNVNLELVRDGHAYAQREEIHSMVRQFEQAEDEARGKRRGLWADVRDDQQPAWRQRWLGQRRINRPQTRP